MIIRNDCVRPFIHSRRTAGKEYRKSGYSAFKLPGEVYWKKNVDTLYYSLSLCGKDRKKCDGV